MATYIAVDANTHTQLLLSSQLTHTHNGKSYCCWHWHTQLWLSSQLTHTHTQWHFILLLTQLHNCSSYCNLNTHTSLALFIVDKNTIVILLQLNTHTHTDDFGQYVTHTQKLFLPLTHTQLWPQSQLEQTHTHTQRQLFLPLTHCYHRSSKHTTAIHCSWHTTVTAVPVEHTNNDDLLLLYSHTQTQL